MKSIFFAALCAFPGFAFAQKASGKILFAKGQQIEVVTNMNISAQSMMGPSSGTITAADTYTVSEAGPGSFTLLKVPKQMKMNFSVGSQEIKIDSDNPKDLSSSFGQPIKDIMNNKPEFTIDQTGKITSVKKDPKKKKDDQSGSGMMGMMLPGMDMTSAIPQEGTPSVFQVLPAYEVGVGDTWTDSLQQEGNKNVTVYTVKNITDNEIILDFRGEGITVTTQSAMGMNIAVNATTKATGNIIVEKNTGIVKQKTSINNTESTMNLGGREVTSTIKSTAVTNVNKR
jgi:hypothetical protein